MRPVNPSLAAFGEKCAGLFWKDMPVHHNIATELSILNGGKGDPESIHYVLPAKRTQEPRLLTRLFSSPRGHYNTVRGALDYNQIYDPAYRSFVGGEVLKQLWPKIYKPLEKNPDFNRPTDLFEHYYAELEKPKKKKPAKEKTAEDEKQAISARLAAKALERASQRAAKGEITPERLKRFVNKTQKWTVGGVRRAGAKALADAKAMVPQKADAVRAFVHKLQASRPPQALAAAYAETRKRIPHRNDTAPSGFQKLVGTITGTKPVARETQLPNLRAKTIVDHYDQDNHVIRGSLLHSPPVLFHELGHALDFGGRNTLGRQERAGKKLLSESMAWRRAGQLYDEWRKALPQQNTPEKLDITEMPTRRAIMQFRRAPLETYRLQHLYNLTSAFRQATDHNLPGLFPMLTEFGPTGRVFTQAQSALGNARRQIYLQQKAQQEAQQQAKTIEFTGEKTPTSKAAVARWREPENLVKIVKPEHATPRLKLLQQAAAKIDPERKKPGGAYEAFLDSLNWHDIPEKVISRSDRVTSHLSKPQYLFRGIVPGDNIRDPLRDHGVRKPFVHATPYPDEATVYTDPNGSWPAGKSKRVQAYQVFRPTARQPYVSDFMLDQTTGKTPPNSDWNLALRDSIRKAVQLRNLEEVNGRQPPRSALPRLRDFMRDRTYETPVTRENRRLGTFLTRDKPTATLRDKSLRKSMQDVQMARIPQAQKGKFEGMARQWQTTITPQGTIQKHVPRAAYMDPNDSRLRRFEMEWRPKHLMTSPKIQKQVDEMLQKIKARERRAEKPTPSQPKKQKRETAGSKKANWLSDYGYHFNKLYNPESYGFDIRTPTGRDDLRNIAVSTAVGTGIGAIRGAIWPGYIEKMDAAGRVISKKKRGRLLGSLRDAITSGALSSVSSAAGITAKKYLPEIEQALHKVKENVISTLPVRSRVIHEGVDTNPHAIKTIQGLV